MQQEVFSEVGFDEQQILHLNNYANGTKAASSTCTHTLKHTHRHTGTLLKLSHARILTVKNAFGCNTLIPFSG